MIIYNKAKWLNKEIHEINVNRYNQSSIDVYNTKVNRHSFFIDYFNKNCAGKQSESAARAARELNRR